MSGTPMSNEQRAAMEQRLAQLRAAQATQASAARSNRSGAGAATIAAQPASQVNPGAQHQAYAPRSQHVPPQMGYGYDEDDEEDEDEEDFDIGRQQFEEEFLSMLAAHQRQQQQKRGGAARLGVMLPQQQQERNAATVAQVNATQHANDGVEVVATDKTAVRSRELGDFEVLRLAKMGDGASMLDFGAACAVDWPTFVDNRGRNALHYAADAGSAALIRKIADDLRVPYVADEQKLTPLDVAVLNGHKDVETDEVFAALVAAATAARHADAKFTDPTVTKTLESVLTAFAPAPPKFVMSKPIPKSSEAKGAREFWSAGAATTPSATEPATIQSSSGANLSEEGTAQLTAAVNALDQHGRLEWLTPVAYGTQLPCEHWQVVQSVADVTGTAGNGATTGVAVAQMLAESTLQGAAAQKLKGRDSVKVAVAAHLAVKGNARRTGVATNLLHALRRRILAAAGGDSHSVVFFASSTQLARPPTPVATVKWYRRVFDPLHVYTSDSAYDVFPDFFTYDAVLRADAVLKGAIPNALEEQYASAVRAWCPVEVQNEEHAALVLAFVQAAATSAASGVELACVPQSVEELRRSCLGHPDHHPYVRTDAQGALTDLVVLRRRDARKAKAAASGAQNGVFAAEVVYAVFTGLSGVAKVHHMMLLASQLLSAKMLLIPTLFGITESDVAKSNFDEIVANREFVYAVSPATLKDVDGLGAVPAAKLSLPLYSI